MRSADTRDAYNDTRPLFPSHADNDEHGDARNTGTGATPENQSRQRGGGDGRVPDSRPLPQPKRIHGDAAPQTLSGNMAEIRQRKHRRTRHDRRPAQGIFPMTRSTGPDHIHATIT